MKPILYAHNETAFDTNGIGILADCLECHVLPVLNGQYELSLKYPISGIHYKALTRRAIILAKSDPVSEPQLFRIYRRVPSSNNTITVYARHIAYDLMGIVVSPFSATGAPVALQALADNAVTDCPFSFWTDITTSATMDVVVPTAIWTLLGGSKGSVLDCFGGEYEFDRFAVKLWERRGEDRGVSIRYGKNLTSLEQDENVANTYTGVYPYWLGGDGTLVQLPEKIVGAAGTYDHVRIMPLDLSQEFQSAPTEAQLQAHTEQYIADNDIGTPSISWKVQHVDLEKTEEYKSTAILERVLLGDTVSVEFADMGVSASARVVAADYDPIRERYNSITLGSVRTNIADTIANQSQVTKDILRTVRAPQTTPVSNTDWITNGRGYMVAVRDDAGNWMELCSLDEPDINAAQNVWRWNNGGFGFSSNGYGGPYALAITQDGHIVADFVTAGTLASHDGKIAFDLTRGVFSMQDVDVNGKECKFRLDSGGFWVIGEDSANFSLLADSVSAVLRTYTTPLKIYSDVSIDIQAPNVTINGHSF